MTERALGQPAAIQLVAIMLGARGAGAEAVDVVLGAVPDPWSFLPHVRVVPEIVAALDLAESVGCRAIPE